ncbi:MAG TPA: hypothetical protein VMS30_11320 [Phycisphaerales bacterium]|jgi:hypothetical protein|nr:hypothetical protein [Phycisphaerales bacterium]
MTSGRYLNAILTVNAALLTAVVWLQVAGTPLSNAAHAQVPPPDGGIPNAGSQRARMIDELVAIRESMEGMRKTLEGGKMKVTIANIDDLKAATAPADKGK